MQETPVRSLGWEDPLEKGTATHSSIVAWRIPMDRRAWRATVHGVSKSWTRRLNSFHFQTLQLSPFYRRGNGGRWCGAEVEPGDPASRALTRRLSPLLSSLTLSFLCHHWLGLPTRFSRNFLNIWTYLSLLCICILVAQVPTSNWEYVFKKKKKHEVDVRREPDLGYGRDYCWHGWGKIKDGLLGGESIGAGAAVMNWGRAVETQRRWSGITWRSPGGRSRGLL